MTDSMMVRYSWIPLLALCLVVVSPLALGQDSTDATTAGDPLVDSEPTSPPIEPPPNPIVTQRDAVLTESLTGTWTAPLGPQTLAMTLTGDGKFHMGQRSGIWRVQKGALVVEIEGVTFNYQAQFNQQQLLLSGGDLGQTLTFAKQVQAADYGVWLLGLSPRAVAAKLKRIGVVVVVVMIAWVFIRLLRWGSKLVILSDRGPLRYIYTRHKNRTLTIHSLVLNLVQYVIYFTALGIMLSELGVNYTTYLASLSVIGLAIGFGSQGLVQDMVTGFFVILEKQYDVGDMVEMSGQTGIVTEMGLRMTRLRNYLGQSVTIPNRSIFVVGTFIKGAQQVHLDVAADPEHAEATRKVIEHTTRELFNQYEGVIVQPPKTPEKLELATGELFWRTHMRIWPNQPWVIDQQLVPRLREALKRAELPLPQDRITVFYLGRETVKRRRSSAKQIAAATT